MTLTEIKQSFKEGGDPVKLFRMQMKYHNFVEFMLWLEE